MSIPGTDPVLFGLGVLIFCLIGLVLGSFSTAVSHRITSGTSWARFSGRESRSSCRSCQNILGIRDLVPLASWMALRGRCRHCGAPIGLRYPVMEFISVVACVSAYLVMGFQVETFVVVSFVPFLLAMAVIDLERLILPNQLMVICAGIALALAAVQALEARDILVLGMALAASVGYALFIWGTGRVVSSLLKKEAIGFGDVKLFGVAGLALGFEVLPSFLILSGALGVAFGTVWLTIRKENVFPFGPALIAAFYLLLVFT